MFCFDAQGPLVPVCVHEEIPMQELRCTLQQAQSLREYRVACSGRRRKEERKE